LLLARGSRKRGDGRVGSRIRVASPLVISVAERKEDAVLWVAAGEGSEERLV
jgi:hypothetical protein